MNSSKPIHATPHINNLIKNGAENLNNQEKLKLINIGLQEQEMKLKTLDPFLDQTYETEHFKFHYTFDGTDAIEDMEYVTKMGHIFEQVWSFHIDTMGFDIPPLDANGFYEIRIENLPSFYFGYAVALGNESTCDSYIKMRNSYSSSQFSGQSEENNIKVTAVHEFFHAIQFNYNCYAVTQSLWFLEATAVWSEDELYDNINDLYRYMPNWFSNPDKAISESSNHMYGSFIFFQYIDEHLGGYETIRAFWEKSRELANTNRDVTNNAINSVLESFNSSFEDAYLRMRIANRILSDDVNALPYTYEEAESYEIAISPWGTSNGPQEQILTYRKGNTETILNPTIGLYESAYYNLNTNSPVTIELINYEGQTHLSSIIKYLDKDQWLVRSGNKFNIDPEVGIEWISLIISAIGLDYNNWDWAINIYDGYSEDFTSFTPYPNPSFGSPISMNLQVITEQKIKTSIFDILGHEIWSSSTNFTNPSMVTLTWNGKNNNGHQVSNGLYFFLVEGNHQKSKHKIIYLKMKN
ncbi:MAG: T9SS type A sorting domain-containing protein [Candidatus Neomarinimicrobiota bacterium]